MRSSTSGERASSLAHRQPIEPDAAAGDARRQLRRVAQLVARAGEQQRPVDDLAHAQRVLRFEIRAQEFLREAHRRRRFGLRLAAVGAASGELERAEQHAGQQSRAAPAR